MNIFNDNKNLVRNQDQYDNYNEFIFSTDRNVIFKMLTRFRLYEMVKHLHGDIVECGVFKGSGLSLWLKIMDMDSPHDIRKAIGFDFFDPSFTSDLKKEDKIVMDQVFTRCENLDLNDVSVEGIKNKLLNAGFSENKFELVKGNISVTSKQYTESHPGFRICLLYMDLDLEEPTYETLVNLWNRVVKGGIVVFDEYAYHSWSEANAVDRFASEHNLIIHKLNIKAPTAFIIKN